MAANPEQSDGDQDGLGDLCDAFPDGGGPPLDGPPGSDGPAMPVDMGTACQTAVVTTFTGAAPGYNEGGPLVAQLQNPTHMAAAPGGGFYVADFQNQLVRHVDTTGTTSRFAGIPMTTMPPARVDGPRLGGAQFLGPFGIAVHPSTGEIYVSEFMSHCIRRISSNGNVVTIAGTPLPGDPMGMCMPGSVDGPAMAGATFQGPMAIAVDLAGNVFVADSPAHRVRKIAGGMVMTVAGDGTPGYIDSAQGNPQFNFPRGLTLDGGGNLLVADSGNKVIRRMTPFGQVTTVAVGVGDVMGVAYNPNGDIYASEMGMPRIWRVRGGAVELLAGTGMPGAQVGTIDGCNALFQSPHGLFWQNGLYVADMGNSVIRLIK
jgi:DNA-binding beta-propeller fold protein YncE